jgi:glycosyltransferase involved in cell wall biosynthesis
VNTSFAIKYVAINHAMNKTILMIVFHYPPMKGSSGVLRSLSFTNNLVDYGWKPVVMTVRPEAHPKIDYMSVNEVRREVKIIRNHAYDAARQLSFRGIYPGIFAWPDRWASWAITAIPAGIRLIKKYKPDVIWSTYPIATAHLIAYALKRISGIPWVADFRDPMSDDNYESFIGGKICKLIERGTVKSADRLIFTTPGAIRLYQESFTDIPSSRWSCVPNGYDEDSFLEAEATKVTDSGINNKITLLHSGLIYPVERDPTEFFKAISELHSEGKISPDWLTIMLRASGHDDFCKKQAVHLGIEQYVKFGSAVPYIDSLKEMLSASGLLIFQSSICNQQIPAKIYEYIRARKPVLALTDEHGDTAALLKKVGLKNIAPLDNKDAIKKSLQDFIYMIRNQEFTPAEEKVIRTMSRNYQVKKLVEILNML